MHSKRLIVAALMFWLISLAFTVDADPVILPAVPTASCSVIQGFMPAADSAAACWQPMKGSQPVSVVSAGREKVFRFPVTFMGNPVERASWDRVHGFSMTLCQGLEFWFYSDAVDGISQFTVYFKSGRGWYRGNFSPAETGRWTRVRIPKNTASVEGTPTGWHAIEAVRISAWRGQDVNRVFYLTRPGLYGTEAEVAILRNDGGASAGAGEKRSIQQFVDITAGLLEQVGLPYFIVGDGEFTAPAMATIKVLILPYCPRLSAKTCKAIAAYLSNGGKLLVCYTLPASLHALLGIKTGRHIREPEKGFFHAIRGSAKPLPHMPMDVRQSSWNIVEGLPVPGKSRVAAWWYNAQGQSTKQAAILASDNGIFMTHVLLDDDKDNKRFLLLAMLGDLKPSLWGQALSHHENRIGRFGPYAGLASARAGIIALAARQKAAGRGAVHGSLDRAEQALARSKSCASEGLYRKAVVFAEEARSLMIEAYCRAQATLHDEHRAFWCHSAFGVKGMDWDAAINLLHENGFNAILPNMLWGGVAFYESEVLPVSKAVAERGDQLDLCIKACRRHGVACHVWKVNYNMGWPTDQAFVDRMKKAGRTQVAFDGASMDRWLCPSHPDNSALEVEAMLEVARKYPVDGIHFDYIRYPGMDGCYCAGCRKRFEKVLDRRVQDWPADLRRIPVLEKQWLDFRRQQITRVVKNVAQQGRRIRKTLKISAAVFRNWPRDRDGVGQDWRLWCERGYLDFVCPMDYIWENSQFHRTVAAQLEWASGVPCYPGIGLSVWRDKLDICRLIKQISITRALKTGGFTIFNYGPSEAGVLLPQLGLGLTNDG